MREKKAKSIIENLKKTYDDIAGDFSNTRSKDTDLHIFSDLIKPKATILDIGCGNGRLLLMLNKLAEHWTNPKFHYLGIDISKSLLNHARKKFPTENFIEGTQTEIPFDESKADILFNIRAFHHIPSKKMRLIALEEMKRVLKPHGTIVITVWDLWQRKYIVQILKAVLRSIITLGAYEYNDTFIPWGKNNKRYYHAFRPKELYDILKQAGFTQVKIMDPKLCKSKDIVITAKK